MSEYSDSEPGEVVRRCSYCGRFCSQREIVDENGLCRKCSEELDHCSNRSGDIMSIISGEGAIPDDESMSSSSDCAANSINTSQIDGNRRDEGNDSGLCARCWTHPPTKLLYNTPICDGCFLMAQEKRVHTKGTKKRYQPPTPNLEPGKTLTRVCDTCRRKRKRCPHRRVVDEDDPEADSRRKKTKKEQTLIDEIRSRSVEVMPDSGKSAVVEVERDLMGRHRDQDDDTDNMEEAITASIHVVYSRELERLMNVAEARMTDAAEAVEAVKRHMAAWLKTTMTHKILNFDLA